jgi:paraquat-inducible protein B
MEKVIADGSQTVQKVQITLDQLNRMLKPDAPIQYRFYELTEELAETARSIRTLVDILERKPNAVIFGKEPLKKE